MKIRVVPSQELLREFLVYDAETGFLYWRQRDQKWFPDVRASRIWNTKNAGNRAFKTKTAGYFSGGILGVNYLAHRVIWKYVHGIDPDQIDHINGNRTDNRLENLRDVPEVLNHRNQKLRSDNSTGAVGVTRRPSGRYRAQISLAGAGIYIGDFDTVEEASAARLAVSREHGFHVNHGRSA